MGQSRSAPQPASGSADLGRGDSGWLAWRDVEPRHVRQVKSRSLNKPTIVQDRHSEALCRSNPAWRGPKLDRRASLAMTASKSSAQVSGGCVSESLDEGLVDAGLNQPLGFAFAGQFFVQM